MMHVDIQHKFVKTIRMILLQYEWMVETPAFWILKVDHNVAYTNSYKTFIMEFVVFVGCAR
jgi:hypothetical protein